MRSRDAVTLSRTRAILETIPGVRVMSSAADNLEVITPAADKGNALGMLCRDIGTDLDHAAGHRRQRKRFRNAACSRCSPSPWATHRTR